MSGALSRLDDVRQIIGFVDAADGWSIAADVRAANARSSLAMTVATPRVVLIGVPTDVGAARRGTSMGPAALRVAGLAEAIAAQDRGVHDGGDLAGPPVPRRDAVGGYRHLAEATAWNQLVFDATGRALSDGALPLSMGGDHSIAIGSIRAVQRHAAAIGRKLRVLWLDAHADCNTSATTPSGNLHGMPVACLLGRGPDALVKLGGTEPPLDPAMLRLVGCRSVDPAEKASIHAIGVEVIDMRLIDELGMREAMNVALAGVDADTHLHVSLDVDFLDPDIAPGVAVPARGGPTYREAQLCMEMIADTGRLASLDIVELDPSRDVRNATAELVVDLVGSLFGKSTLARR